MKNTRLQERRKQIKSLPWYKRLRLWFKVDFVFRLIDLKRLFTFKESKPRKVIMTSKEYYSKQ